MSAAGANSVRRRASSRLGPPPPREARRDPRCARLPNRHMPLCRALGRRSLVRIGNCRLARTDAGSRRSVRAQPRGCPRRVRPKGYLDGNCRSADGRGAAADGRGAAADGRGAAADGRGARRLPPAGRSGNAERSVQGAIGSSTSSVGGGAESAELATSASFVRRIRRRPTRLVDSTGRRMRPPKVPAVGARSHARAPRPRLGNVPPSVAACSAIRRLAVRPSVTTSSRPTDVGSHPRSRAIAGASLTFRSSVRNIACRSVMIVLTSTINTILQDRCHARMSIEPRSPRTLNDASTAVSQPASSRSLTTISTRLAWAESRRRSTPSSRQRTTTSIEASRASNMARSSPTWMASAPPVSTRDTRPRDTSAALARSTCRQQRRCRSTRSDRPMRGVSTRESMPGATHLPLIWLVDLRRSRAGHADDLEASLAGSRHSWDRGGRRVELAHAAQAGIWPPSDRRGRVGASVSGRWMSASAAGRGRLPSQEGP